MHLNIKNVQKKNKETQNKNHIIYTRRYFRIGNVLEK